MPATHSNICFRAIQVLYRRIRYGYWEPKTNRLQSLLEQAIARSSSWTILQIGANDGITHDLVYPFLTSSKLQKAVLVEPLPAPFAKLSALHRNNPRVILENVAIAQNSGTITMYTINEKAQSQRFDSKISSLDRAHLEKFIEIDPKLEQAIKEVSVQAINVEEIIKKHDLKELDLLYIDAEGYDYEILKMFPWQECSVRAVYYEQGHLGLNGIRSSYKLLRKKGFRLHQWDRDALGIR